MGEGGKNRLKPLRSMIGRPLEVLCGGALLVLMAVTVVDVFGRYLLNAPLLGAYELSEIAIGVIVAAALPLVTSRGGHVRLTLLDRHFGRRGIAARDFVSSVLMAVATGVLAWRIWVELDLAMRIGTSTDLLGIPLAPAIGFVTFAFALSAVAAVLRILHPAADGTRPASDD